MRNTLFFFLHSAATNAAQRRNARKMSEYDKLAKVAHGIKLDPSGFTAWLKGEHNANRHQLAIPTDFEDVVQRLDDH